MRDRRNTNLSTSSSGSIQSSPSSPSRSSMTEKRCPSPPPDGALLPLPATTKENWSKPRLHQTMVLRLLTLACVILIGTRCLMSWPATRWDARVLVDGSSRQPTQVTAKLDLPADPAVVEVPSNGGRRHWMVSIPETSTFPLSQYHDICTQADALGRDEPALTSSLGKIRGWRNIGNYGRLDDSYVDVQEAQERGLLPSTNTIGKDVCARSMTFILGEEDTSFGKSLLLLWLSYGLSRKEGRAFFIDDTRWAYGKYTTYFMPPPSPGCTPPPWSHIVPCPHGARHVAVSSTTAPWTFGPAFKAEYAQSRRHGLERSHAIFDLLRTGYEDLFHLFGEDATFVQQRTLELKTAAQALSQPTIGIHIRRGDLHPFSYEYNRDYLPLETYTTTAQNLLTTLSLPTTPHKSHSAAPTFLLASDDPALITSPDLLVSSQTLAFEPPQSRILLATKHALDASAPKPSLREPNSAYTKHVPENAGWDGGFYPSLFANHGNARVRELVARGYLLDLAVMGKSDGVVCAVSSASCRVLGIMLGWEGVKGSRWRNVDDGREWSWDGSRW